MFFPALFYTLATVENIIIPWTISLSRDIVFDVKHDGRHNDKETPIYQSLIGSLQWAVSLARFDIAFAVMTLSSFRAAPRRGHLERSKRVCGYLYKFKHSAIRIRVREPDYSDIPEDHYDWASFVYVNVEEQLPHDAPEPLGHYVRITHYVDANLYHNYLTGRSVNGILDLLNGMPIDWYSKKQATVETATYGSEFIGARTCVERSLDFRNTLRYLGVSICKEAFLFGDNKSVVDSSTVPHSKLHKRHNALSFHRCVNPIACTQIWEDLQTTDIAADACRDYGKIGEE